MEPHGRVISPQDPRRSPNGSYGFAVQALATGLEIAMRCNWITPAESRREMRAMLRTVQEDAVIKQEIAALKEKLAELRESQALAANTEQ